MKRITAFGIILIIFTAFVIASGCTKSKNNKPVYTTNCADSLVGIYSGSDYCSSGQTTYPCSITAKDSLNITFSNINGVPVNGIVDCNKNTITIPSQTFPGNFSISGNGTFTANRIIINWSGISLGGPVNCSTTYTR